MKTTQIDLQTAEAEIQQCQAAFDALTLDRQLAAQLHLQALWGEVQSEATGSQL